MIGLYYFGVVALWGWLTWLLLRFGWRVVGRKGKKLTTKNVLVGLIVLAWLSASFWYGGGRKFYYDAQVRELCAKDGGVKVYEQVVLPGERFDVFGNVHIPIKAKANSGDRFYYERTEWLIKKKNPEVWRTQHKIVRASDGKVIGESISYARHGGDLPGPWHPSSFGCPDSNSQPSIYKSVFEKEIER